MTAPAAVRLSPQLNMRCPLLSGLPSLTPAPGYGVRHYRPGDAAAWERVIGESFQWENAEGRFAAVMRGDVAFRPERVWFVCRPDGQPVATAAAWYQGTYGRDVGTVHMVGALAAESGRGLGALVTLAALHQMVREGRSAAILQTDDFRLPAIVCYLKLGFAPLLVDENQRQRWRDVFRAIDRPALCAPFEPALAEPLFQPVAETPEVDTPVRHTPVRRWHVQRERRGGPPAVADLAFLADESLHRAGGLGTVRLQPDTVRAGEAVTDPLWLTYTVGREPLGTGATVTFTTPGVVPLGFEWQTAEPDRPGFCALHGPPSVTLVPVPGGFQVRDGELQPGEDVSLLMMATAGLVWSPVAGRRELRVVVDPGQGEFRRGLPEPAVLDIRPGPLTRLDVYIPCTRLPDAPVPVRVVARDDLGNTVPSPGAVRLTAPGCSTALPLQGVATGEVTVGGTDPVRLTAALGGTRLRGRSNVCVSVPQPPLFVVGDLHVASVLGGGSLDPDEALRRARQESALDFACLPLPTRKWGDNEKWLLTRYVTERWLQEGRFVTLLGCRWQHSVCGDRTVLHLGGDQPFLAADDRRTPMPLRLCEALRTGEALAIVHAPGDADGGEARMAPDDLETDVERLVAVPCLSEADDDPGTDGKRARRTVWRTPPWLNPCTRGGFAAAAGGLTGVWAASLTRRDVFAALRARRTCVLSGARIVLRMTANGAPMGSELPAAAEVAVRVDVWAPGRLAKVEILRDRRPLRVERPTGDEAHLETTDSAGGPAAYWCRVTQSDGHVALGSPVWVG